MEQKTDFVCCDIGAYVVICGFMYQNSSFCVVEIRSVSCISLFQFILLNTLKHQPTSSPRIQLASFVSQPSLGRKVEIAQMGGASSVFRKM